MEYAGAYVVWPEVDFTAIAVWEWQPTLLASLTLLQTSFALVFAFPITLFVDGEFTFTLPSLLPLFALFLQLSASRLTFFSLFYSIDWLTLPWHPQQGSQDQVKIGSYLESWAEALPSTSLWLLPYHLKGAAFRYRLKRGSEGHQWLVSKQHPLYYSRLLALRQSLDCETWPCYCVVTPIHSSQSVAWDSVISASYRYQWNSCQALILCALLPRCRRCTNSIRVARPSMAHDYPHKPMGCRLWIKEVVRDMQDRSSLHN